MKNSPIKFSLKTEILPIAFLLIAFAASVYFYLHFPDRVPTHWNWKGEIDGWSGKSFGAFFLPILNVGMYILFLVLPFLDPKRENYKKFAGAYLVIRTLILGVLTAIYFITSLSGLGYKINVAASIPVLIGIMFVVLGAYMGKLKLNWTIGNRNMWTLSSENVWNKTNKLTGILFIVAGIMIALGAVIPKNLIIPTFLFAIALVVIVPTIYSYILYSKEKNGK